MSDLISRSEVNDVIDELEVYTCGRLNTMKVEVSVLQLQRLINKLKNIPTAYDIDKVVEELEKSSKWVNETNEYCDDDGNDYIPLSKAIEIVKHVDVSDDVCEWKYNDSEYYFESSCEHLHIFMSDGPKENEYRFCPYCGKKIKVVE